MFASPHFPAQAAAHLCPKRRVSKGRGINGRDRGPANIAPWDATQGGNPLAAGQQTPAAPCGRGQARPRRDEGTAAVSASSQGRNGGLSLKVYWHRPSGPGRGETLSTPSPTPTHTHYASLRQRPPAVTPACWGRISHLPPVLPSGWRPAGAEGAYTRCRGGGGCGRHTNPPEHRTKTTCRTMKDRSQSPCVWCRVPKGLLPKDHEAGTHRWGRA